MNTQYSYRYKELWGDNVWDTRQSSLIPLARWIDDENIHKHRINAKPVAERRTEGEFDPKAGALTYPEVVEAWEKKGLHYHCTSMTLPWIAMVPVDHLGKEGYTDDMDTILVLVNADQEDTNFGMYTLERYKDLLESAAETKSAVLFVISDKPDLVNQYISITQEAVILFHLNYDRLFLDISTVLQGKRTLRDIEGFSYSDLNGKIIYDPDTAIVEKCGAPVIDISQRWTNKDSLIWKLIKKSGAGNTAYDRDALMNSEVGKKLAEAMNLEFIYDSADDPELLKYWERMGVTCEFHEKKGEQWITFSPPQASKPLPCMCIFHEVNRFDPHQAITAFSFFHEFIRIAAQGECIVLFFALESLDDNDLLHEILKDARNLYSIDSSRIYVTGHSHNGRFAAEYMRRHQKEIAALATLGNEPGQLSPAVTSGFFQISDEKLDQQASVDTPTINVSGFNERNSMFPLSGDAPYVPEGQWVALNTFEKRSDSWQRRLRSSRCPNRSIEEIAATKESSDYVERLLGIPADRTEVLTLDGSENYIADIKNKEGKHHLRIAALGNMPHTVTPAMIKIAWSYLRQFARDQETGECIEL